jgi:hypothetical protein
VYGGVRLDAEHVRECVSGEDWLRDQGVVIRTTNAVRAACDIPLSTVADTLTLPLVLSRQEKEKEKEKESIRSLSATPPTSKDGQ